MKSKFSKSPSYLVRNSHSYCFRMYVPKDLRIHINRKELRYSLRTGYLSEAKDKARAIAVYVQMIFKLIRRGDPQIMKLTDEQVNEMIRTYFDRLIAEYDEPVPSSDDLIRQGIAPPSDYRSFISEIDDVRETFLLNLQNGNYESVEKDADQLLMENGVTEIDKESSSYRKLCAGLIRSEIKGCEYQKKQLMGEFSDDLERDIFGLPDEKPATQSTVQNTVPSITLSELVKKYIKENLKAENWKPTTVKEYVSSAKMIEFIFGSDTLTDTIGHPETNRFKEVLTKLPPNIFKFKKYKGKSVDEILGMEEEKTLSIKRINGYLTNAGAIFRYAVRHGYMDKNFAEGLKIKQRVRPDQQQDIFDGEDLRLIFESNEYVNDKHDKPYKFWVPMLGLYTGCRIEEICQLYLEDIKQVDGLWVLDINQSREDQTLKNLNSARVVPLHPFIVEDLNLIGFTDSLKAKGGKRLFPELKRTQGKYSHYVSRWFGTFKKKVGVIAESNKKTFHSFRHTFTDNLKQQMVEPWVIDEITGHALQSESMKRYGKRYIPKILFEEAIMKLNYEIDLSHLKNSKYVVK